MVVKVRDVTAYAAEVDDRAVKVRDVSVYVLQKGEAQNGARNAGLAVLSTDIRGASYRNAHIRVLQDTTSRLPNWATPGLTAFLAALNSQNKKAYDTSQINIGTPQLNGSDPTFNSFVPVSAKPGLGYSGTRNIRFNRYDLSVAFSGKDLGPYKVDGGTTVHQILSQINASFGLSLTTAEVEDAPYDKAMGLVQLKIKAGSWYYLPGSTVLLGSQPLVFATKDLSGFTPA